MDRNKNTAKILVGSGNPVKLNAAEDAFLKYYEKVEVVSADVESGVPDQPVNSKTFDGASNRVERLIEKNRREKLGADYFAGLEGGIINIYSRWFSFGAVCIEDKKGRRGFGTSAMFELPRGVVEKLLSGVELGDVMDSIQSSKDTKRRHGAVGYFTKGAIERRALYRDGIITALIPLLNGFGENS